MVAFATLAAILRTEFETLADANTWLREYDNTFPVDNAGEKVTLQADTNPFVIFSVGFEEAIQRMVGRRNRFDIKGNIVVQVRTPLGSGEGSATTSAATIGKALQNKILGTTDTLRTLRASYPAGRVGLEDSTDENSRPWWIQPVTIPWLSQVSAENLEAINFVSTGDFGTGSSAIRVALNELVETVIPLPVQYPNAPFDPPSNDFWLRLDNTPQEVEHSETADTVAWLRHRGRASISIYGPIGVGEATFLAHADTIATALTTRRSGPVRFESLGISRVGQDNAWWRVDVSSQYYFSEVVSNV